MSDFGAYKKIEEAFAGLIAEGIDERRVIKSRACADVNGISFGAGCWGYIGDSDSCYPIILDVAKIVFNSDFDGTDALSVTINGVESATVTYTASHSNTMDLLRTAITVVAGVDACIAPTAEDATKRTIYVRTKNTTITVSVTEKVATIPTSTITYETDQVFLGIATSLQKSPTIANQAKYDRYEMVNILEYGVIWALSSGTVLPLQQLYCSVTSGATLGRQTVTPGKNINTFSRGNNLTVQTSTTISKIEVRGIIKPYTEKIWV